MSVGLAMIRINVPMIGAGLLLIGLGTLLTLIMPEHGFKPTPRENRSTWYMAGQTLRAGLRLVRQRTVLVTIFGIAFFFGMASETFDRLWEVHFLSHFVFPLSGRLEPVVWFGIINAGALVLSMIVAEIVRRRLDTDSHLGAVRILFVINALLMLSVIGFGLAGNFAIALTAYWSANLLRRTDAPIFTAWLNQSLEPSVRATVLSMHGQVDAIGQIAGGPLFGLIATVASTRTAMVAAGLVLAPALLLYLRTMRRGVADGPIIVEAQ
jgi:DHA3 family tetracycline resistance protein-like MFS transporter